MYGAILHWCFLSLKLTFNLFRWFSGLFCYNSYKPIWLIINFPEKAESKRTFCSQSYSSVRLMGNMKMGFVIYASVDFCLVHYATYFRNRRGYIFSRLLSGLINNFLNLGTKGVKSETFLIYIHSQSLWIKFGKSLVIKQHIQQDITHTKKLEHRIRARNRKKRQSIPFCVTQWGLCKAIWPASLDFKVRSWTENNLGSPCQNKKVLLE